MTEPFHEQPTSDERRQPSSFDPGETEPVERGPDAASRASTSPGSEGPPSDPSVGPTGTEVMDAPPAEAPTVVVEPPDRPLGAGSGPGSGSGDGDAPPRRLGPYEIVSPLGRGGMGVVYRARHVELDRECALKVLIAGEDASEATLARFVAEARVAARLDRHPGVVRVLDAGREGRRAWLAMELVEGTTLLRLIQDRAVDAERGAAIVAAVARALAHAHREGVIHRDVKPGNVLIDAATGAARLADFGVAKALSEDHGGTATGDVLGSIAYMAPEQASDAKSVDARADVYGLGAVLYELLVGRPPHEGASVANTLASVLTRTPPPPSERVGGVDAGLEAICLRAMARDRDARYRSADALAEALEAWLGSDARPGPADASGDETPVARVLIALAAAAVVVACVVFAIVSTRPPAGLDEAVALLADRTAWASAGEHAEGRALQDLAFGAVADGLGERFERLETDVYPREALPSGAEVRHRVAAFRHVRSGVVLHLVPGGRFSMGSADPVAENAFCLANDEVWSTVGDDCSNEGPARAVTVAPFLIGRFPVRIEEWDRIGGTDHRDPKLKDGDFPIFGVAPQDAAAWLAKAGDGLRLPSEAEWEHAVRAGTTTRFFWGDEPDLRWLWSAENSAGMPRPVSEHARFANPFGLVDMLGNVYEPCQDVIAPYRADAIDAAAPVPGRPDARRVARGGSWQCGVGCCRSAYRGWGEPWDHPETFGLRAARSLPELR